MGDATQRILLFNAAAEKVFGWPRDAVLGQPVDKLLPQRLRDKHRAHIERFGRTGATARRMGGQTVLTGLRANGEEFPIEASISQHSEGGRQLFTVILRDISERIEAEALLARREARLRGILNSAMDAIITIDDAQHVVLFNGAAEAMFGCPRDEALGAPLAWFIPDRFRSVHAEQLAHSAMPHAEGPPHASLSDREYQVFQLLVSGKSVSDIALHLNLSVKTVSTHKARLMEKMALANQTELIHYAIKHRLVDDSASPG